MKVNDRQVIGYARFHKTKLKFAKRLTACFAHLGTLDGINAARARGRNGGRPAGTYNKEKARYAAIFLQVKEAALH